MQRLEDSQVESRKAPPVLGNPNHTAIVILSGSNHCIAATDSV